MNMELIRNAVADAAKRFGAEEYELTVSSKEDTGVEALKKEITSVSYSRSGSIPTDVGQPMIRVSSITVGGQA